LSTSYGRKCNGILLSMSSIQARDLPEREPWTIFRNTTSMRPLIILGIVSVLLSSVAIQADDWKKDAEKAELDADQIQRLSRDKILLTDMCCYQIFSPYVEPAMPVFITTDSVLNAYHVLLEESVLQMEQANCEILPEMLTFLWDRLPTVERSIHGKPETVDSAKRQSRAAIGVTLDLLGVHRSPADSRTEEIIRSEVQQIEKGTECRAPSWLDGGDDDYKIDYSRYKPRGFYAQTDALSRYFRAVSWLQSIPFRVGHDDELLAILTLGNCVSADKFADQTKYQKFRAFPECYREFIGDRDDWDLANAATLVPGTWLADSDGVGLAKIRRELQEKAKATNHAAAVNDVVVGKPISLVFRVLSAYRTPDAILFQRTTDPNLRPLPSGLDVCIALGSTYAAESLNEPDKDHVLSVIRDSHGLFSGSSLYFDYLRCLSTLFARPAYGSPAFMSGKAWQAKSCNTALAGWAQLRHTWMLQAKQTCVVLDGADRPRPVGFVEPNPAFFEGMRKVADRTAELLKKAGTRNDSEFHIIAELQNCANALEARAVAGAGYDSHDWDQHFFTETLEKVIPTAPPTMTPAEAKVFYPNAIKKIKEVIAQVQRGQKIPYRSFDWHPSRPVLPLWEKLGELSEHLRTVAETQMAASPFSCAKFSQADHDFILSYGAQLAPIMFHVGDVSEVPRDDTPRIVDVCYAPSAGEYLEAAIGRPQIVYMLYPTTEGEVFCRGAVLPYYEFRSSARLDDAEWKNRLDSVDAPARPSWCVASNAEPLPTEIISRGYSWPALLMVAVVVALASLIITQRAHRRRNANSQNSDDGL
jgi:hypothetical protein